MTSRHDTNGERPDTDSREEALVAFLRRNRPLPPPPSSELEESVLAACRPRTDSLPPRQPVLAERKRWPKLAATAGVAALLAAALLLWVGHPEPVPRPVVFEESEISEMEEFVQVSWDSSLMREENGDGWQNLEVFSTEDESREDL